MSTLQAIGMGALTLAMLWLAAVACYAAWTSYKESKKSHGTDPH